MSEPKVKKSTNPLRVRRLRQTIDEVNYISRVLNEIVGPLRDRRIKAVEQLRELMLDEGIPLDAAELKVDDEKMTIQWIENPNPASAPAPAPVAAPAPSPAAKRRKG